MKRIAVVTIVSNNYIHFAKTLMQSISLWHPEADRYCVIVDLDLSHAAALKEFTVLDLASLRLPDGDAFLFQYDILELNTAIKPWALEKLINNNYDMVVFVDPDIFLYQSLSDALEMLESADMVLTPHLLSPVADELIPGEVDIRRAGIYNLGFCAVRNSENARAILHWWQSKLHRHCIVALDEGYFVDQGWMDLAPCIFEGVGILRHPGYNVAYWNLAQRPINCADNGEYLVLGKFPLVFFHYSGLNPMNPLFISRHQNRYTLDTVSSVVSGLIQKYCQHIISNGISDYSYLPYSFDFYDDGSRISAADRKRFRCDEVFRRQITHSPFLSRAMFYDG